MEKTKRKRGISLSHQATPHSLRESELEESRVRQIVRPFAQNTTSTASKQPRFSSAPKPHIIFSYARESAGREPAPFLNSKSNSAFSRSSSIKQPPPALAPPAFTPIATPKEFDVTQQPRGVLVRRLFSHSKAEREEASEVSTQTERKNYFINNQFAISQNQQSLQAAFAREEYEKLIQTRRKHLGISNKVLSYRQDAGTPAQTARASQPFSKVEILQEEVGKRSSGKTTAEDLQSLQDMEKRLREIINICDSRLG